MPNELPHNEMKLLWLAKDPTNSTANISISTLNPQAFSAYKFALFPQMQTCDSVDFSAVASSTADGAGFHCVSTP